MKAITRSRVGAAWAWARARAELLVPLAGLPLFFGMVGMIGARLDALQTAVVWGLAALYAGLVLWSPLALPSKEPRPIRWPTVARAAAVAVPVLLLAVLAQSALAPRQARSAAGGGGGLGTLLLWLALATAGLAAEQALPVDLFPIARRRQLRRLMYVVAAALFLSTVAGLWDNLFGTLAQAVGAALGEVRPPSSDVAAYFEGVGPLALLATHLISAGLEEMVFRVGVMTLVWAVTRRWGWGLLVSALLFGLYHVTLSAIAGQNQVAPVTTVLQSVGAGLSTGVIYRCRGFGAAALAHGLGNWLMLMLLTNSL